MLTFEQMKELLSLVNELRLGGVEVQDGAFRFRVSGLGPLPDGTPAVGVLAAAAVGSESQAEPGSETSESEPEQEGHLLQSPIVGTFYTSPSPDSEAYVQVGDAVQSGQVVCIVEAMKLMNEIEADVSGVVLRVFPQNAQPVEFGEALFLIDTG